MGQHIKGGKIIPRELTEEEKLEAEALKSKRALSRNRYVPNR